MLNNLFKFLFPTKNSVKPNNIHRKNLNPVSVTVYTTKPNMFDKSQAIKSPIKNNVKNKEPSHSVQSSNLDAQNHANSLRK